jgi:hypothetical protein
MSIMSVMRGRRLTSTGVVDPRRQSLVKPWIVVTLMLGGVVVMLTALLAFTEGRPQNILLVGLALAAVGVLPASIIVATGMLLLGLLMAAVKQTRKSGVPMASYAAAYLCGALAAVGLFLVLSRVR